MAEQPGAEQIKLLFRLVETARAVPRRRQKFELHGHECDPAVVYGAGLPEEGEEVLVDDVWALHNADLILGAWNYAFDPQARFTITPRGERLYDQALERPAASAALVENPITRPPTPR